ncbi:P-loop containing nucleoside triphosphate hydrolase protein [Pisolithus orientalis]|uniref:P-loop containing nucleoside triphosphate hydrolase protein n=1 Tax=Pisolithus orientalis TaxID=936130 RepID=UPI002224C54F|nr:P-loop containing nucleoside triphosphate hydrolase protein [Pisolithus orientalis]KAI6005063.1 P-loop containing nucleoside triphosphate hydrolase protein [Pisolithus orientalis]
MDAFQLLSRGGVRFDKQRFQSDVRLFNKSNNTETKAAVSVSLDSQLPPELDFFKYATGGQSKRKVTHDESVAGASRPADPSGSIQKRRKVDAEDQLSDDGSNDEEADGTPARKHRVVSKGSDVPMPADKFEELAERYGMAPRLLANLREHNYKHPTGVQAHGIPILLEGRDLAAISPTGTGKTLAYLLPVFSSLRAPVASLNDAGSGVRALVLAPTRELAHQIHNECLKLATGRKWRLVLFNKATASTLRDKNVRDKVDIIISTPLRLVAAIQEGSLELNNVRHLILDEADRLLDNEFIAQVQEVVAVCTYPDVRKAVFSATLPAGVEKLAMGMLRNPIRIVVGLKDTPLPLIAQSLTYVADDASKLPSLLTYLAQPYNPPLLIFTSTQPRASSLAEELTMNGVPNINCLHAGMTKKERDDAVSRMRRGESWIMVTTEVMARGMDFKGVREVINYDFPMSVQSYIHRIGRTGRAGREGKAVTYFTDADAPYLKSIANVLLQSGSSVPEWILKLPKPSRLKKKQMGRVKRAETVNPARKIGRRDAIRKRDMVTASKRRKEKEQAVECVDSAT